MSPVSILANVSLFMYLIDVACQVLSNRRVAEEVNFFQSGLGGKANTIRYEMESTIDNIE